MKHLMLMFGLALSAPAWSAQKTVTLSIPGMNCATCPITVKKALTKLDGVLEVKSNLDQRETTVVFDDAKVTLTSITQATKEAGFPSTVSGARQ
ncbi:mercury resistance system periplasmic binding protein MerP [Hydrogenophaga sp.]|uniref:mercury resistance system periplasmic binding protein MerP n=1 Tax=Hydrogenophaga sp. TaxID=1904254 RepID=UPI0025BBBD6E|nr:mercury resistance system periplasmic binding protein MerP [Hydrogenophaga sp.]MBT9465265.1 mercury resistance system periplasmic binding protein MerP [Hydrogenophaga sp.]